MAEMKPNDADIEEVADVGWLLKGSRSPKLPDRDRSLVSDEPDVADPEICRGGSRGCDGRPPSAGVAIVPMGVLSFRAGGSGLESRTGISVAPFTTALTLGDGGMERPSRGVREDEFDRDPGIGGRRRGAGEEEDMEGGGDVTWGDSLDATMGNRGGVPPSYASCFTVGWLRRL